MSWLVSMLLGVVAWFTRGKSVAAKIKHKLIMEAICYARGKTGRPGRLAVWLVVLLITALSMMVTNTYVLAGEKGTIVKRVAGNRGAIFIATLAGLAIGGCSAVLYRGHQSGLVVAEEMICNNFTPITIARSDTKVTQRQIVEHNAVWEEFCNVVDK